MKKILKKFLRLLNLEIDSAVDRGVSIFGLNIRNLKSNAQYCEGIKGSNIIDYCLKFNSKNVLDVGAGSGIHAEIFAKNGSNVLCIDYGTSKYAKDFKIYKKNIKRENVDFNNWENKKKYDLVWASHVLEHQQNVGIFLKKLINCCNEEGYICIMVPFLHRTLWGGHLSLWTPGLLAYNIVLQGINLSHSKIKYGYREFAIIFKPKFCKLPEDITFDYGDLDKLRKYLPYELSENSDPWI